MRKLAFIVFSLLIAISILTPQIPVHALLPKHESQEDLINEQMDISPGETIRVSVASDGTQGDAGSSYPSLSADGGVVAFHSSATNLVVGDTNDKIDIFVNDLNLSETSLTSVRTDGSQVNTHSEFPSISADGNVVAFFAFGALVPDPFNPWDVYEVFVHNRQSGETVRASVATDGTLGWHHSYYPSISADGRYVAFVSLASNLVADDTNEVADIFVRDLYLEQTIRVNVTSDGTQANSGETDLSEFDRPSISADGRYVVFSSSATNLVADDTNGVRDIFVHDLQTGETTLVSKSTDGIQGNGQSTFPLISDDGRYVLFSSISDNLEFHDPDTFIDVFIHDLILNETILVSVSNQGIKGNSHSAGSSISSNGRYVVFTSAADNLVSNDTNGVQDVFLHDRQEGMTKRISVNSSGIEGNDASTGGSISADGSRVAFNSGASNLVPDDTNNSTDVFIHQILWSSIPDDDTWDIGFLPNSHGYSFENYSDSSSNDFTEYDMIEMFGDDAVCININGDCVLKLSAQIWLNRANASMSGGHCDGMAVTSLRLFVPEYEAPSDFDIGAFNTYSLQKTIEVRRYIANYFVRQLANPVMSYKSEVVKKTPLQILEDLKINMSSSPLDPATLIVRIIDSNGRQSGHAITPYKIENVYDGTYKIWVYDNNYPGDSSRYVTINTFENTWSYYMGDILGTWNGSATTNTLGYVPISYYEESPVCAWCSSSVQEDSLSHFWFHGDGSLLVEDLSGNRLGFIEGQYYNEIENGYLAFLDLGVNENAELIYVLPDGEYSLQIYGEQAQEAGNASLIKFGPDHSINIDNIPVVENQVTQFNVNASGSEVVINADNNVENINLSLVKENATSSSSFTVGNVDVGSQDLLSFDTQDQKFVINGSQASNGVYDFSYKLIAEAGIQEFVHNEISILEGTTHYINYAGWDGISNILLEIDLDSDGTIDEEIWLADDNYFDLVFFPIISK